MIYIHFKLIRIFMLKKIMIFIALSLSSSLAFSSSYLDVTKKYSLPPEMSDCKVIFLRGDIGYSNLFTIKCPTSTVQTSTVDKNPINTLTWNNISSTDTININGYEYKKVECAPQLISCDFMLKINN